MGPILRLIVYLALTLATVPFVAWGIYLGLRSVFRPKPTIPDPPGSWIVGDPWDEKELYDGRITKRLESFLRKKERVPPAGEDEWNLFL